ncbi:MAG: helix-turn-helix domain-containing protein [Mycobacteriaceae bacterium]|nr:helix-turn-helix domain-containing protein [Mycobacteriaceae bacterium]
MGASQRAELAAFLKAQRARLRPADVGLPDDVEPGRRRTPGLRREEVAELAGLSLTWYTWLEQGRRIAASPQVVAALARALKLDADAHGHLRRLAGLADPAGAEQIGAETRRLQRLVDAMLPNLAVVHDAAFDFVVWNTAFATVRANPAELPADRRNLLWLMFTDERTRTVMPRWEAAARAILSQFRATVGGRPDDARLAALVADLSAASPEFRAWWAEYRVQQFRPVTIDLDHPDLGPVNLDLYQLRLVENPDLLLVVQVPTAQTVPE